MPTTTLPTEPLLPETGSKSLLAVYGLAALTLGLAAVAAARRRV